MTTADVTVFVVDDDVSVRKSVARLIESVGLKVETFASAREYLKQDPCEGPACLVLDVRMPEMSGLDLQDELTSAGLSMPIIFITGHGNVPMSVKAVKAGAVDFIEKPFDGQTLLDAINEAIKRDRKSKLDQAEINEIQKRVDSLTKREKEVFALVVQGLLNKQIAFELGTSEKTVKVHRGRVMEKMQAESLADLVRMAERIGIDKTKGLPI
jgi:FixJ family two-component response regulator